MGRVVLIVNSKKIIAAKIWLAVRIRRHEPNAKKT